MADEKRNSGIARDNRFIKRMRVMHYFIDAAAEIAETEGLRAVTIRTVAKKAGYNSATLYNYFENLDELKAFASIDLISDWVRSAVTTDAGPGDELDHYILNWKSYVLHALRSSVGFTYIYASKDSDTVLKYFEKYFELFPLPEEQEHPGSVRAFWKQKSVDEQEAQMIQPVVDAGWINQEDARSVYKLCNMAFHGILWERIQMGSEIRVDEAVDAFMRYTVSYIRSKLKKEKDLSPYLPAAEPISRT